MDSYWSQWDYTDSDWSVNEEDNMVGVGKRLVSTLYVHHLVKREMVSI